MSKFKEPAHETMDKIREQTKQRTVEQQIYGVDAVKKETRLRVWTAIFYPESSKEDWQQIWEKNFIRCCVSPLHDRDVYEEDGEDHAQGDLKKPHYHVVFQFSGPKSYNQVYDILKLIALDPAHCPPPQRPLGDIYGCVQYHVHYNHKDKAQYLRSEITSICGFDVDRYFKLNLEQEDQVFCALLKFINKNSISEYWVLVNALNVCRHKADSDSIAEEMFVYARKHTILLTSLLSSRRSVLKAEYEKRHDHLLTD